jgi:hypothetical protein
VNIAPRPTDHSVLPVNLPSILSGGSLVAHNFRLARHSGTIARCGMASLYLLTEVTIGHPSGTMLA